MNTETTEIAALRSRIADLEQQLKLSDEGVSKLAQRSFDLEQQLQARIAAELPKGDLHTNSPLLLPKLFYDCGFGLSEQDCLAAPSGVYDEINHTVTAAFELPKDSTTVRFDPGELPCCVTELTVSDERITLRAANGIALADTKTLFLCKDPNFYLEGLKLFPAGLKLVITYNYYPLENLAHEPLFQAVLDGIELMQHDKNAQNQRFAAQQKTIDELSKRIAELEASCNEYDATIKDIHASTSWKLTAPVRLITGLFHRS